MYHKVIAIYCTDKKTYYEAEIIPKALQSISHHIDLIKGKLERNKYSETSLINQKLEDLYRIYKNILHSNIVKNTIPLLSKSFIDFLYYTITNIDLGQASNNPHSIYNKLDALHTELSEYYFLLHSEYTDQDISENDSVYEKGQNIFRIFNQTGVHTSKTTNQDISNLTKICLLLQDLGKFAPRENHNGFYDYSTHTHTGPELIQSFTSSGNNIVNPSSLSRNLRESITDTDITQLIIAIQKSHLELSTTSLGEQSITALINNLNDPHIKYCLNNPILKKLFINILYRISIINIASKKVITSQKIKFIKKLLSIVSNDNILDRLDSIKENYSINISQLTHDIEQLSEEQIQDYALSKFASLMSSPDIRITLEDIKKFIQENFPENVEIVISTLTKLYSSSVTLKSMHKLFSLIPDKSGKINPTKFNFLITMADMVESKKMALIGENYIHHDEAVCLSLNILNCFKPISKDIFIQQLISSPNMWWDFFERSFDIYYSTSYNTWNIVIKLDPFSSIEPT